MFLFAIRTYIWSLETNGYALDFAFATMFSKDGLTLAISDFVLVLSTAICVPFAKAIKKGYIRYNWFGLVLQHVWQMTVLFVAIKWAFNRHWPWVQSGYLTLHSLVMIMKMHSYMSTNGYLQSVHIQSQQTLSAIHRLAEEDESIGGYENAVRVALETRKRLDELTNRQPSSLSPSSDEDSALLNSSSSPTPTTAVERLLNGGYKKSKNGDATPPQAGTPMVPEGSSSAFIDPRTAAVLRHRLNLTSGDEVNGLGGGDVSGEESDHSGDGSVLTATTDSGVGLGFDSTNSLTANGNGNGLARTSSTSGSQEPSPTATSFPPTNIPNTKEKKRNSKPTPHPLVDHPDERISSLAKEYTEMEGELTGIGPEYVRWPENITYKNFAVYQLVPTLVYELEYPRTDRIRPLYVFEKTVAFFGTFALLYTVTERFILPFTPSPDQSFFRSLLDLALPFMVAYLLLFYIIFECICNAFAELSYFADRRFYDDWYDSSFTIS
ncbi:hypothetical protein NLI96_g769 [Meripilus lineatus]|uniref:O-acyltransferase n=1 Tax=Meripilus lineatus TaxID=2056292 RepID=A0AAD5VBT8_9APHY|nr:hypothetical protein NLI96_g769 [Physisporinus lineatus]